VAVKEYATATPEVARESKGKIMHVELHPISEITPYAGNPRINDRAVAAVAASIRAFGFRQPIVVDEAGVIIAGHTRYKAALQLGLRHVPVHVAAGLTPTHVRAYRLADNKTAELADWDYDLLAQELAALQGMEFDLDRVGFSEDELNRLLDDVPMRPGLVDPDDIPGPPEEAVTQPGDVWRLGKHRLLCGDAGKAEDVDRLLGGAAIHLVHTDPPYTAAGALAAGYGQLDAVTETRYNTGMRWAEGSGSSSPSVGVRRVEGRPAQLGCLGGRLTRSLRSRPEPRDPTRAGAGRPRRGACGVRRQVGQASGCRRHVPGIHRGRLPAPAHAGATAASAAGMSPGPFQRDRAG